jgi:hypothetical protein
VVSGSVASASRQAGAASAVLQYLFGLRALGHDVWFIDQLQAGAADLIPDDQSAEIAFGMTVMSAAGFGDRFSVLDRPGGQCRPLSREAVHEVMGSADLLLNLSGRLADPELCERIPVRVFVDLDPGFCQLWAQSGVEMNLDCHTHFATLGWALGTAGCAVPLLGRRWIRFRPPVALDAWPLQQEPPAQGFTTVANWRSYGPAWDSEVRLGLKAHSFRKLVDLPRLAGVPLTVALQIDPGDAADLQALERAGWSIVDGGSVTATVAAYHDFIAASTGEIAVAKEGYVVTRCGWFSERSAAYLASGRPVIAQATGFEDGLPTGDGLIAFDTADDAAAAMEDVVARYDLHSRHARELAREHFGADRVMAGLIDEVYAAHGATQN